jgi:hypothetical protein
LEQYKNILSTGDSFEDLLCGSNNYDIKLRIRSYHNAKRFCITCIMYLLV